MKHSSEELNRLRAKAEVSMKKTSELQQVLAQIEASLTRKEVQKVKEKSQYK